MKVKKDGRGVHGKIPQEDRTVDWLWGGDSSMKNEILLALSVSYYHNNPAQQLLPKNSCI